MTQLLVDPAPGVDRIDDPRWRDLVDALTRRELFGAAAGLAAMGMLSACGGTESAPGAEASAASTREVTTPLGTYDIPVRPSRVIAVDSRVDLELALALGLPVIGHNHSEARPWLPLTPQVKYLSEKPNLEQILALQPDLIICANEGGEWWPADKLLKIAPVLTTDFRVDWRENLTVLAAWLGVPDKGKQLIAGYQTHLDGIKALHADLIPTAKVCALSYLESTGNIYITSTRDPARGPLPTEMTLHDLGGVTSAAKFDAPENALSLERLDLIADSDGFMLNGSQQDYDALMSNRLWQKLPAVKKGMVTLLEGDVYFGSVFTMPKVADGWSDLYTKIAAG
ncbi:ABC-type Fe3+-hydroxamate transport system, substrate-binding protein [Sinosporangium album]|uniref:ABC-type Fe3+-hydroxamate transport system, substrate-binding protein n=1 Tax=Sinosporangium album TaxID=504805 RepID=A0A1G8GLR7_9ACTN|nr:ABC transporter substrate-binding protein [Sinosporangium album]SDH95312.1 ABC-type Fe3+-hydroxamate transport system, substrate-binding protein [Sinosporangium album]